MPTVKSTLNNGNEWESHLFPKQGIYLMRTGVKRMLRQYVDVDKTRMDFYEFGIFTSISIAIHPMGQVDEMWCIDPTDGKAREMLGVAAFAKSERDSISPDEIDDAPIISWVETKKSTVDGLACRTYQQHIGGIETSHIRYVSIDSGFLVQQERLLPCGKVKEVTKWTIELLGPPPAEVFSIAHIQRELRDQAKKTKATKQKGEK